MDNVVDSEEEGDPGENGEGNERALSTMVVDLGYQVASGDIQGDSGGYREGIGDRKSHIRADKVKDDNTDQCRNSDHNGCTNDLAGPSAGGEYH